MKNKLKFSKDGLSLSFIFADKSESIEVSSKEAGFEAIMDLAQKGRISDEEADEFGNQLLLAEKLPWVEQKSGISVRVISLPGMGMFEELGYPVAFGGSFGASLFEDLAEMEMMELEDLLKFVSDLKKLGEIPNFTMCDCGEKHGHIFFKTGVVGMITSKKTAMLGLEKLQIEQLITVEDGERIKTQIAASELPEE